MQQYNFKIKKLPKSEVEIEVSLPAEELEKARPKALKKFSETLNVDGFRKGNVPEKIVLEKVGEKAMLEEAAEMVLNEHYPQILTEAKLDTIGHPAISITKLALGNPLEFKVRVAVLPVFELPEYRKIASEIRDRKNEVGLEITDKEVEDVILQIRKNKAHFDYHKNHPEDKNHNHKDLELEKEENLPILDDEFAKTTGNFANVVELKVKIKENIVQEKENRQKEKKRSEIIEALLKNTMIELPDILILSEVEKSLAQFKDDIVRMGGSATQASRWEEYLAQTKKSEEDVRKDLHENSEKKAKIQLILNKIAEVEKLEPNKAILEHEVGQIMEHYKDANHQNARIYVATLLLNQEVLKLLEQQ